MCGFVGQWGRGMNRKKLEDMSDLINHRGPDHTGYFTQEGVEGAFHVVTKRLSIQDLSSSGNQPMVNDRYVLAFNGEVYNHVELRQALGPDSWFSSSDTETLLRAFLAWGAEQTLAQVNGVYSIVLWDRKNHILTLARDPMGVKPLYYAQRSEGICFSSELKALRSCSNGRASREAIALYLLFGYIPSPWSALEGIYKVQPGECLVFQRNERPQVHYIGPKSWTNTLDIPLSYAERKEFLHTTIKESVHRQLLSDAPVGIFLSGGIDSSILAAVMAQYGDYHSFSLEYADASDEANGDAILAQRFTQSLGWQHTVVTLGPSTIQTLWPKYLTAIDEPIAEANFLGTLLLSRAARQNGIKVVLTGDGADEIFHGYGSYRTVRKGATLNRIPMFGPIANAAAKFPLLSRAYRDNLRGAASIWKKAMVDRFWIAGAVMFDVGTVAAWLGVSPELVTGWVRETVERQVARNMWLRQTGVSLPDLEMLGRLELGAHVADHYNIRLDKATMSQSVEARVPFQDIELVNVGLRLPGDDKLENNQRTKAILRDVFADRIPSYITDRVKQTFQAPVVDWVNGTFFADRTDSGAIQNPWDGHLRRRVGDSSRAYQKWGLLVLNEWMSHNKITL